jgi:hypothetical protein
MTCRYADLQRKYDQLEGKLRANEERLSNIQEQLERQKTNWVRAMASIIEWGPPIGPKG